MKSFNLTISICNQEEAESVWELLLGAVNCNKKNKTLILKFDQYCPIDWSFIERQSSVDIVTIDKLSIWVPDYSENVYHSGPRSPIFPLPNFSHLGNITKIVAKIYYTYSIITVNPDYLKSFMGISGECLSFNFISGKPDPRLINVWTDELAPPSTQSLVIKFDLIEKRATFDCNNDDVYGKVRSWLSDVQDN